MRRSSRRKRLPRAELALFAVLMVVYNVNLRQASTDTAAARRVPISIVREGNLALDEYYPHLLAPGAPPPPMFLTFSRGHLYDTHPIVGSLLALPIYAVPVLLSDPSRDSSIADVGSKLAASLMAALSALFVLATARRVVNDRPRTSPIPLITAGIYALGTPMWSTASQGLWTHTPAVLCWSVALWGLLSNRPLLAGATTAAAVLARPANAPAAAILLGFVLHRAYRRRSGSSAGESDRSDWRDAIRYAAGAGLIGGVGIGYNLWLFGSLTGGLSARASHFMSDVTLEGLFSTPLLVGLSGLTVSPSRGLLVFSPILFLALLGAFHAWRTKPAPAWAAPGGEPERETGSPGGKTGGPTGLGEPIVLSRYASVAALAVLLAYAKYIEWWGGHGYGPRYLTDMMPFCGLLVAFGLLRLPRMPILSSSPWVARLVLIVLFAYSGLVQAVGAFSWPCPWTGMEPHYRERLWDWRDNQIAVCARAGPRLDPTARRLLVALGLPVDPEDPYAGTTNHQEIR